MSKATKSAATQQDKMGEFLAANPVPSVTITFPLDSAPTYAFTAPHKLKAGVLERACARTTGELQRLKIEMRKEHVQQMAKERN